MLTSKILLFSVGFTFGSLKPTNKKSVSLPTYGFSFLFVNFNTYIGNVSFVRL